MRKRLFNGMLVILLGFAFSHVSPSVSSAQGAVFGQGDMLINANVGLKFGFWPQLQTDFQYGVVSFGQEERWTFAAGPDMVVGLMHLSVAGKAALHYANSPKLAIYFGTLLGYSYIPVLDEVSKSFGGREREGGSSYLAWDAFVGFRYMFNTHHGLNVELAPTWWPLFTHGLWSIGYTYAF